MSVPGNPEAVRGQGGCSACFLPSVPFPQPRASNGSGISVVHFLEGVNYLVDEHICQQAEGAASVRARGGRSCASADLLPAPRGGLQPVGSSRRGTSSCPLGLYPGFLFWSGPLCSELWVPPLEGSLAS